MSVDNYSSAIKGTALGALLCISPFNLVALFFIWLSSDEFYHYIPPPSSPQPPSIPSYTPEPPPPQPNKPNISPDSLKIINEANDLADLYRYDEAIELLEKNNLFHDANNIKLKQARNYEKSANYGRAAELYEQLGMWEKAKMCRNKANVTVHKNIHLDANILFDQISSRGLVLPYKCPSCGGSIKIDGSDKIEVCPYCNTSVNFELIEKIVRDTLGN